MIRFNALFPAVSAGLFRRGADRALASAKPWIAALRAGNRGLRVEVAELAAALSAAKAKRAGRRELIVESTTQVGKLRARIAELKRASKRPKLKPSGKVEGIGVRSRRAAFCGL